MQVVLSAEGKKLLPEGYSLYAPDAAYTVTFASGDAQGAYLGSWSITGDGKRTTYVTGYGESDEYTNMQSADAETNNLESAVLIIAARTAASNIAAITDGNKFWTRTMKTLSGSSSVMPFCIK